MAESKVGYWQGKAVRDYYLKHPDASISEVVKALKVNQRTVTRGRKKLVEEGLLQAGRHGVKPEPEETPEQAEEGTPLPKKTESVGQTLLDHKAMTQLADTVALADESDDDITRKNMLREVKKIMFNTALHPDTRMSAMQTWTKLKDMARNRELGPGKPLSYEDAKKRAVVLFQAIGPKLALDAMYEAFNVEEPDGKTPTEQTEASSGTTEDVSETGHTSNPEETSDLRPLDMGSDRGPSEEHQDRTGPSA